MRAKDLDDDDEAWNDFVAYYERFIYYLMHAMRVDAADIPDLKQVVLIKIWKNLRTYESRGSKFRTWLSQVVRNAVIDYYRAVQRRSNVVLGGVYVDTASSAEESTELDKLIEEEWEVYMINYALGRLLDVFSETAVNVFELSLKGQSSKEIARQLDITVNSVYTLKNRVKSRLIKEVNAIIREVEV